MFKSCIVIAIKNIDTYIRGTWSNDTWHELEISNDCGDITGDSAPRNVDPQHKPWKTHEQSILKEFMSPMVVTTKISVKNPKVLDE